MARKLEQLQFDFDSHTQPAKENSRERSMPERFVKECKFRGIVYGSIHSSYTQPSDIIEALEEAGYSVPPRFTPKSIRSRAERIFNEYYLTTF